MEIEMEKENFFDLIRNIKYGNAIPKEGCCDQPYTVITNDNHWPCVCVKSLRIYDRALRVSEAVGNFRAAKDENNDKKSEKI